MQIKKTLIKKGQATNMLLFGVLFSILPVGEVQAQTKPLPAQPAPAKLSVTATGPIGAITSCPLLSSPFSSPATKAQMRQVLQEEDKAYTLVKIGDAFAQSGDWQNAQSQYQQALDISPQRGLGHQLALYGLIAYCRANGDTTKGMDYSRQAIYHKGLATEGFYENDTEKLMQFALLLNKTGQSMEAVQVYNHAASALDYQDSQYNEGRPHLKVILPEVVMERTSPAQVQYTPEHLQALADTAIAYKEVGFTPDQEILGRMQEAVKLYPDSPVTHYYRGEIISAKDTAGAKAEFQKAAELGDEATAAAAKERLKVLR